MSLVKITQYASDSVPQHVAEALDTFIETSKGRGVSKSSDCILMVASHHDEILGFCEARLDEETATLRQVFVRPVFRERKIGLHLLRNALKQTNKLGCERMQLACKDAQIGFFAHGGFRVIEAPYESKREAYYILENPSLSFFLNASSKTTAPNKARVGSDTMRLGEDRNAYHFSNEHELLDVHKSMLSQARRDIWLLCDNMNERIFTDPYIAKCFLRLIKRNAQADIRILVSQDKLNHASFNYTVNLAQRLSSHIDIRILQKSGASFSEQLSLIDGSGSIYRRSQAVSSGFAYYNNRLMSKKLRDTFEQHWQFSKPTVEFRRLAM